MSGGNRVDEKGKARKGSQHHMQWYVNEAADALANAIVPTLGLSTRRAKVTWHSPLATDGYQEYRDGAVARQLGLAVKPSKALAEFWPRGGPVWDALAVAHGGDKPCFLFIEAKSHLKECESACKAKEPSRAQIVDALEQARKAFTIQASYSQAWLSSHYQLANRLATVAFLCRQNLDARLVNIFFTDDKCWRKRAVTADVWRAHEQELRQRLGFGTAWPPFVSSVYVPARGECV